MFNNDAETDSIEQRTYLLDAVELNGLMPVKTELMQTADMAEQL
jgi:hypothetical protein